MTRLRFAVAALLCSQILFAEVAHAQTGSLGRGTFRFDSKVLVEENAALQSSPPVKRSSPGGRLLRNALIGAAIGGAAVALVVQTAGDCGNCTGDRVKGALYGAMYGAMIGAAVTIHPSRGLFHGRSFASHHAQR